MRKILDRYRVTSGKGFRLKDHDPADTGGHLLSKPQAEAMLAQDVQRLSALQDELYAQNEWALLCVLQAMDAAGKDGTIKHVMSGVNPQGVQVTSFKAPGPEELAHDFLWRANRALPERGHIGIFNRSHYEEVLVVRVHPEFLERQHLPKRAARQAAVGPAPGGDRRLRALPDAPGHGGAEVLPQRVEGRSRSAASSNGSRSSDKHWKFSASDLAERAFWDDYQARLPGGDRRHRHAARALVRRAGGQQVVHPADRGRRDDRGAGSAGPEPPRR